MHDPDLLIIEVVGEGKTDIGSTTREPAVEPPDRGVVPILVHKLCGHPVAMRVKRRNLAFLQGKGLEQKVKFSKRQAKCNGSAGFVFVIDTEGDHPARFAEIAKGRNAEYHDFPAAIGVAHSCIESWLLSGAGAIRRAMGLQVLFWPIPDQPEELPAPCKDRVNNPKTVLASCAGKTSTLSSSDTSRIARELNDLDLVADRCPLGFAPFKAEVEERIRLIFTRA